MKQIAIHFQNKKEDKFAAFWIAYCEEKGIPFKIVNCFAQDSMEQIRECDGLMFHFALGSTEKMLFSKQLIYSIETIGIPVFPNFHTMWHYDDKVGQKYLLEAISAPVIPTFVFYNREDAESWANQTNYPKVFKLRNGASSSNVKLVKDKPQAFKLIRQAFGEGFPHERDPWEYLKEKWRIYKLDNSKFGGVKYAFKRLFYVRKNERKYGVEQGYCYFQEFIPDNKFDIRVIVIEGKAFAIKRMVRNKDFRASGSGMIKYEREHFPESTIRKSFEISKKLKTQSVAFDFVYLNNQPLVVEISYCFTAIGVYEKCTGYWDENLTWHDGPFNPYGWMVDTLIKEISQSAKEKS